MTQSRGFVLNASGDAFLRMAVKLARSLRTHCPDVDIDLFTDAATDGAAFTRVQVDPAFAGQGKIPAMRASRFERSIYMDVDMMAVADLRDVFDVLDAFDWAMCHDPWRNTGHATRIWRRSLPPAFPQFNGGLIAWKRSPATDDFLRRWQDAMAAHGEGTDQPALRELMWLDRTLRVATLPEEYNLWDLRRIDGLTYRNPAPRVLHNNFFKRPRVLEADSDTLRILLGHRRLARLRMLMASDLSLGSADDLPRRVDVRPGRLARLALAAQGLRDIPRHLRNLMGSSYL